MSKDTNVRGRVLKYLQNARPTPPIFLSRARRVADITEATGLKKNSVRGACLALYADGIIERVHPGLYQTVVAVNPLVPEQTQPASY